VEGRGGLPRQGPRQGRGPGARLPAECRDYATHWLGIQRDEFVRLGVAGDWPGRYATMDFRSEALIAAEIGSS
jgi:isoleucyl-tRNA synthetase